VVSAGRTDRRADRLAAACARGPSPVFRLFPCRGNRDDRTFDPQTPPSGRNAGLQLGLSRLPRRCARLPWYESDRIVTLGPQHNRYPEDHNRIGQVQAGDGTSIFLALWEFDVKPGCDKRLKSAYGPDEDWAQLFRRDPAYQRTLPLRDTFRDLT